MAPVVAAIQQQVTLQSLVLQCAAPTAVLEQWFPPPFTHVNLATDQGIPMLNAVQVDPEETFAQYEVQWHNRDLLLQEVEHHLRQQKPDLVLSNNSHLLSRAAARLGIPCFHLCSLNWADLFKDYCGDRPQADAIYESLCADYNTADAFFRLPPHMPMPGMKNLVDVGPVCTPGKQRDLRQWFDHSPHMRYVLVTMGGMPYPIPFAGWPRHEDLTWINGGAGVEPPHEHFINASDLHFAHRDLVASSDVVITKPGYGTFVEAACAGTPVLYLPRGNWPEEPYLLEWQKQRSYCAPITRQQLAQGSLLDAVNAACGQRPRQETRATGSGEIVDYLLRRVDRLAQGQPN